MDSPRTKVKSYKRNNRRWTLNHHLKFYAEDGDIYQVVGIFGTHIGKVEIYEVTKRLKLLLADLGV